MRSRIVPFLAACSFLASFVPGSAVARETEHFYPFDLAVESDMGKAHLLDVKLFWKGQKHPAVAKKIRQVTEEHSTRGAFRSDAASCKVAVLSALRALQERAQEQGGDAVVDIVSITWNKQTESDTDYRCIAGTFIVHVGLKGTVVKLK